MEYINALKIERLLKDSRPPSNRELEDILLKSRSLKRLSVEEAAKLLAVDEPQGLRAIFDAAAYVKDVVYGRRVVLFVPLYISNYCINGCLYCAFKSDNKSLLRKALSAEEIKEETACLLRRGHKRILLVAGENAADPSGRVNYYVEAIKAIYSVKVGSHAIRRVNINCAPLAVEEFKLLKAAGIGTYQLFQETYHKETYLRLHPYGPKRDYRNRIDAIDRAFMAGIDDVGIGVLYGLYDYRFDTLAMLAHIEHLEEKFKVGPHTISVPRIEPAEGTDFYENSHYRVSDEDFGKVVAVLRLAVPYTGMILSTRESPQMRDELFNLGVSQISAESSTAPGGYANSNNNAQFCLGDHRSLEEIINSLLAKGFIPSFCAACYRKERTGEKFMCLAKPGTIKGKCSMNALITLKEYLDDFALPETKNSGYRLISRAKEGLDEADKERLFLFFSDIDKGMRDLYV